MGRFLRRVGEGRHVRKQILADAGKNAFVKEGMETFSLVPNLGSREACNEGKEGDRFAYPRRGTRLR